MPLFGRKPTLDEAVEKIREELRNGTVPGEMLEELRRRDQPLLSGGREPPGLQELLEAVPGGAALLEVGGRMVARNAAMTQLLGRAAAETLLDGGLQLPDQARDFVQMIARHADRLTRLTDDLLDLSRLETGAWKPQLGPVQLAPLADAVLELFRARAEEKSIVLQA